MSWDPPPPCKQALRKSKTQKYEFANSKFRVSKLQISRFETSFTPVCKLEITNF